MELSEKDIELVELYKDGRLDDNAKADLESRMEADPVFKSEVQFCMAIFDSLEMMSISVIRDKVNGIKQDTPTAPKSFFVKYRMVFISVGLILLLLLAIFIIQKATSPAVETKMNLADTFFEPYPALGILRNSNSEKNEALELYASGNYEDAIAIWENELSGRNDAFYLGVAYIATDQPERAIKTLEQIDTNDTDIPANTIQWYIALARVKSGESKSALPLLQDMEPPFKVRADSLMQMIL